MDTAHLVGSSFVGESNLSSRHIIAALEVVQNTANV